MSSLLKGISNLISGSTPETIDKDKLHINEAKIEKSIVPELKSKPNVNNLAKIIKKSKLKPKKKKEIFVLSDDNDSEDEIDISDDEKLSPLEQMIESSKSYIHINDDLEHFIIHANELIRHKLLNFSEFNRIIDPKVMEYFLYNWDKKIFCHFDLIYRKDKDLFEIANGQHRYCALSRMSIKKQKDIIISVSVKTCGTNKAVRDYIRSCNKNHPFDPSNLSPYRYSQIVDDLQKRYPGCIKINRPYINNKIFKNKLIDSKIYQNISISSEDIVNKIVCINEIMYEMAKSNKYCMDKKSTKDSCKRAKDMKMMLGLDQDYRWIYFLDQDIMETNKDRIMCKMYEYYF